MNVKSELQKMNRYLDEMGFVIQRSPLSEQSQSGYFYVYHLSDETYWKIRVSDHQLPPRYEQADIDVGPGPEQIPTVDYAVIALAKRVGVDAPRAAVKSIRDEQEEHAQLEAEAKSARETREKQYLTGVKTALDRYPLTPDEAIQWAEIQGLLGADRRVKRTAFRRKLERHRGLPSGTFDGWDFHRVPANV